MSNRFEVRASPLATRQIKALRGPVARRFTMLRDDTATQGCGAFQYRLTGTGLNHLCDRHLTGRWRVIALFAPQDIIWVIALGEHLRDQPAVDIYATLYRIADVDAEPMERRTKPPCCDPAGLGPIVNQDLADRLIDRATPAIARGR